MKKHSQKLALHKEVVRTLTHVALREVAGGDHNRTFPFCVEKTTFCGDTGGQTASCTVGE